MTGAQLAAPAQSAAWSRRGLLAAAAGAGVAGTAGQLAGATSARAATGTRPQPMPYTRTPVPDRETRHLINRFSCGFSPGLLAGVRRAGGAEAWFTDQLNPGLIDDDFAGQLINWFPHLGVSPQRSLELDRSGQALGWEQMADFARWTLLRRMYSRRQLQEVMVDFWSNLLHITVPEGKSFPFRFGYDKTIRGHALGRFDDLLTAAITHPAMLTYLDNDISTAEAPNENLGRELLELHTVGRATHFSEADVKNSTLILTGWQVDRHRSLAQSYSVADHYHGPVRVLEFSHRNDARTVAGCKAVTNAYLRYLAHHPATAHRVARKLAVRFVSDYPSSGLVSHLAGVFRSSGTDIRATLRAMINHPEFAASRGAKVRTPIEDLVASWRALGVQVTRPSGRDTDAAYAVLTMVDVMGQRPFDWPRPDGFPDTAQAWTSDSRMLGSFKIHHNSAGGWGPTTGVRYASAESWIPEWNLPFAMVVDHICRRLLGRRSTPRLLYAACKAVDATPRERIGRDHRLVLWRMQQLLQVLLDSPEHMSR